MLHNRAVDTSPHARAWIILVLLLAGATGGARAQATAAPERTAAPDPARTQVSRAELQKLLTEYTQVGESKGYSAAFRQRAAEEATLIRARLADGDLQVGDRVELSVEGQTALTDTFTVRNGRVLSLPMIGEVPLKGVLRSELEPYLTRKIAEYVRDPVVHARSLLRLSVTGSIQRPGFYVLPSESLLTDALMAAGGPSQGAKISKISIERDGHTIWDGEALQQMITEGRTLDELSLRAGDRIIVPGPGNGGSGWDTARYLLYTIPPLVGLITFLLHH